MSSNLFLSSDTLRMLKPVSNNSSGFSGKCFWYGDNVIKVFDGMIPSKIKRHISKQIKLDSKVFMYPRKRLYVYGDFKIKYKGYLKKSAPGYDLPEIISKVKNGTFDIPFERLLSVYYDYFLLYLLKEEVLVSDVKMEHIFVDDSIYLIDTDLYEHSLSFMSDLEKKNHNLFEINSSLYRFFYQLNPNTRRYTNTDFYKEEYLYNFIKDISKDSNGMIKTLSDFYHERR